MTRWLAWTRLLLGLGLLWGISPQPAAALDAADWNAVLRAHVAGGRVNYAALKADPAAMAKLDAFLEQVASMPEQAPLSDWLNAYNASVVRSVVRHHPLDSVRNVPGFFDRETHRVAGRARTLDEIGRLVGGWLKASHAPEAA